ncbi:MAG TPA: hypothetical protein VE643_08345, partial [Nitrososphaeraceae archaeon]|nr:hypothetical protein [Nitrososphaeraceae archaeon]
LKFYHFEESSMIQTTFGTSVCRRCNQSDFTCLSINFLAFATIFVLLGAHLEMPLHMKRIFDMYSIEYHVQSRTSSEIR